jgi:hypothetical protein
MPNTTTDKDLETGNFLAAINVSDNTLDEVLQGLQDYFDKALGTILLYRFEREQYALTLMRFPGRRMSEIYGAEHLLRLFGFTLAVLNFCSSTSNVDCTHDNGSRNDRFTEGALT